MYDNATLQDYGNRIGMGTPVTGMQKVAHTEAPQTLSSVAGSLEKLREYSSMLAERLEGLAGAFDGFPPSAPQSGATSLGEQYGGVINTIARTQADIGANLSRIEGAASRIERVRG